MAKLFATAIAAFAIAVAPVIAPAAQAASRADDAQHAASWLASKQTSSGTFGDSRANAVAETLAAVVAGGVSGKVVTKALTYIRDHGQADAKKAAFTGRIVSGIVASGGDPQDLGGVDYVAILDQQYDEATGSFDDDQLFPNLLGALGALAAHGDLPPRAVAHIETHACDGGGFGFNYECRTGPDVDTTSLAINALIAADVDDGVVDDARAYLLDVQRSNGGFSFVPDDPVSSDSTGLVLTAIAALGEDPQKAPWRQSDGDDPVSALRKLQHSTGAFVNGAGKADLLSTTNATPGMAGLTYPIHKPATSPPPLDPPTPKPATGSGQSNDEASDGEQDPAGASPSPRDGRGDGDEAGTTAAPSGKPGEVRDGKAGKDDLEAGGSFGAPDGGGSGGPNRVLLGGLFVASLAGAGTCLWYLRFKR